MSDLKKLSDAATPGPWVRYQRFLILPEKGNRHFGETHAPEDAAFICAVVNAYRAGELVERAKAEKLAEALARIERWVGEFPDTGEYWDDGSPVSYGAAYGSNGQRDFMRGLARAALAEWRGE